MPNRTENPLGRKYRQTAFDHRAKHMTVYDFTYPMTRDERISLFATVRQAVRSALENHHPQSEAGAQAPHSPSQHETWWQFLRENRQKHKRLL